MKKRVRLNYEEWIKLLSKSSKIEEILNENEKKHTLHMNKKEHDKMLESVSEQITENIFNTFLELIKIKVMESEKKEFVIPNFGTFSIKIHKGHKMKANPHNEACNVYMEIPAYKLLKFTPSNDLKNDIIGNNKYL